MSDYSILEQCLLTCDAPESVWRPALESMMSDLTQANRDNVSAFDLLSRVRMALGDNGKRMQDELIEYCEGLAKAGSQLSQAREALEEMAQPVQAPNGGHCSVKEAIKVAMDDYNWMKIKARAALAAMEGEAHE